MLYFDYPVVGVITVPLALWSAKTPTKGAEFFSRKDNTFNTNCFLLVGVITDHCYL